MFKPSPELKDALLFLLPFFFFLGLFSIYPIVMSFYYTLNDISLSHLDPKFIGFQNYIRLLSDKLFQRSLIQTLIYLTFHTAIGVPLGLGIALVLNEEFKGRSFVRACLLIPWSTPPIVAALMFFIALNPGFGPINYLLEIMRLTPPNFSIFGNPDVALIGLAIVSLWKSSPLFAFIFLSALQNLPSDTVESAKIYGASSFAIFKHIVLPFLKPVIAVNCILSCLLALSGTQAFDLVIGITGGGPGYSTYMLYYLAYMNSFPWNRLGYGSTIAYIVTLIAVIFALILIRLWYRRERS